LSAKLLVTTSHSLLALDPATGKVAPIHRGEGLYYGIATDGARTYVAARGRMVSSTAPPEDEHGSILVFDAGPYLAGRIAAPFPLRDMHEIFWHEGRLWITCSFDNMVAICTPSTGEWERWFPLGETATPPLDVNHFNSFAIVEGGMGVVAHNFGASELLVFDIESRALRARTPFGMQSHNIRRRADGTLFTCSSAEGTLLGMDGWTIPIGGFTRGVLQRGDETWVGISEKVERQERDLSTGRIAVLDHDWREVRSIPLPGEGLVLDIQELP
jgi:hypothetical protein